MTNTLRSGAGGAAATSSGASERAPWGAAFPARPHCKGGRPQGRQAEGTARSRLKTSSRGEGSGSDRLGRACVSPWALPGVPPPSRVVLGQWLSFSLTLLDASPPSGTVRPLGGCTLGPRLLPRCAVAAGGPAGASGLEVPEDLVWAVGPRDCSPRTQRPRHRVRGRCRDREGQGARLGWLRG